jgi:hypothetical protein
MRIKFGISVGLVNNKIFKDMQRGVDRFRTITGFDLDRCFTPTGNAILGGHFDENGSFERFLAKAGAQRLDVGQRNRIYLYVFDGN